MASIFSIVYQPGPSPDEEPYQFNRIAVDKGTLIAGKGLEGDLNAVQGTDENRQLNLLSLETVEQLAKEGYKTKPGELGEQIIVEGLDVMGLKVGDRLRLGTSTMIEMTEERTPCLWFQKIQNKTVAETMGRIGIMARVIKGGTIKTSDQVQLVS